MRMTVNSHALPVHMKNRITSLLCIFETTINSSNELITENERLTLIQYM